MSSHGAKLKLCPFSRSPISLFPRFPLPRCPRNRLQRTFAHRTRRHIMMTELELISGPAVDLELTTLYDPLCGQQT